MKKFLTGVLLVLFVISISFSAVSANQEDSSETVEGWGSYISTGRALVTATPICYFNRDDYLLVWVTVENGYTNEQSFTINSVDVYHYDGEIYGDTGDFRDGIGAHVATKVSLDIAPVDLGPIAADSTLGEGVSVELDRALERKHSLFADAVR